MWYKRSLALLALIFSMGTLSAQQIQAFFDFNEFHAPEDGAYLETYLTILGESVQFSENENGKLQARVEVTLLVKDGEEIKSFKKYTLKSPEVEAMTQAPVNFIDQQRLPVENGTFALEVQLQDLNVENSEKFTAEQPLVINHPATDVFLSDLQLVESYKKADVESPFTKSGYELVPLNTGFYSENMDELTFYLEVYNSDKALAEDGKFMINYFIESFENSKTLGQYFRFSKQTVKPVNVLISNFDIAELPSGNYNLVAEVRTKENKIVASKKVFFQRSKPLLKMDAESVAEVKIEATFVSNFTNPDTLREHLYSMRPISNDIERGVIDNQFKNADLKIMQQFFYSFWYNRNPADPEAEWADYYKAVQKVEKMFGTKVKRGYMTDRGEVYLKYGAPNTVTDRPNEPTAYPYQIWHYYKIGRFNNKRFVFYAPELTGQDYYLLHSEVPGEPMDYQWRLKLNKRDTPGGDIDATQGGFDHYGGRTDDFYTVPR